MTKERKIEILKDLLVQLSDSANILCTCEADERCEVVEECIKTLEQQGNTWSLDDAREDFMHDVYNTLDFLPTNNEVNRIIDSFNRVTSDIEQQPCEDCVSRQAVDHLCFEYLKSNTDDNIAFYEHFRDLPPVTPTQNKEQHIYIKN